VICIALIGISAFSLNHFSTINSESEQDVSDDSSEPDVEPPIDNSTDDVIEEVYIPKFHIYNFEFHGLHQEGYDFYSPSYVSFFMQNIGNGTATDIVVSFEINFTFSEEEYVYHAVANITQLESAESQYYHVHVVEPLGMLPVHLNIAHAQIECAEKVTEEFTFTSS